MLKNFVLPATLPAHKILSVDIGGTLAKVAFYVPKNDPIYQNNEKLHKLTSMSIPSKYSVHVNYFSRACKWGLNIPEVI